MTSLFDIEERTLERTQAVNPESRTHIRSRVKEQAEVNRCPNSASRARQLSQNQIIRNKSKPVRQSNIKAMQINNLTNALQYCRVVI